MKSQNKRNTKGVVVSLFFCVLFATVPAVQAKPVFARLFSDHAVLQREKPVPVWGWAEPGESVTVSLAGQSTTSVSDADGKWVVFLNPLSAGGPYTLEAAAGSGKQTVTDILVGEVWLCSGQSNMEWTVKDSNNFAEEKKDSAYDGIRHFLVEHEVDVTPKKDLDKGDWKVSTPETVGDFTAVGFFFAREIHKKLNVPVGLIHSSWGGSEIEPWISKQGMFESDELRDYASRVPSTWSEADKLLESRNKKLTLGDENAQPTSDDERKYLEPGYDYSKWHSGSPMWQWDWQGIWAWRGNGYLAKKIEVPADFRDRVTTLGLAESYSYNEIYINGKEIVAGIMKGKREILVPKDTWKAGENWLVVKMNRTIEPEWFGLGFMGSAGDVFLSAGEERIELADRDWKMMPAFAEPHSYASLSNNFGTGLFNGMIAPLVPYAVRGVLWYQGESNAGRSFQYRKTFPLLIRDWRRHWNDEFFFYFVQLSSYGKNQSSNKGSGWAELREAQTMALSVPKTGMAITTDIGNPDDVHPRNKQDVGKRLAANALKITYGFDVPYSGPRFESVSFERDQAIVSFRFAESGLAVKDKYGYVRGFEIAGADKVFYYAQAIIKDGRVVVSHPKVEKPAAVRYAWSDAPVDANLYNGDGFPAVPFRTDDWKGVTEGKKYK